MRDVWPVQKPVTREKQSCVCKKLQIPCIQTENRIAENRIAESIWQIKYMKYGNMNEMGMKG